MEDRYLAFYTDKHKVLEDCWNWRKLAKPGYCGLHQTLTGLQSRIAPILREREAGQEQERIAEELETQRIVEIQRTEETKLEKERIRLNEVRDLMQKEDERPSKKIKIFNEILLVFIK